MLLCSSNPGILLQTIGCPFCLCDSSVTKEQESPYLMCASCKLRPHHSCLGEFLSKLPGEIGWLCPTCCERMTLQVIASRKIVNWAAPAVNVPAVGIRKCETCKKSFDSDLGLKRHLYHKSNARCRVALPPPVPSPPGVRESPEKIESRLNMWREKVCCMYI